VNVSGSTLTSTGIQAAYGTGVGSVGTSLNTTINNSGSVLVNTSVSNSTVYGIAMKGSSNNSTINNSGKITLTGGNSILRGTYAGIYRSDAGTNGSEIFTINNTGDITTDAMSYAIYTGNTKDTVNIDGGNILGNIGTGIANDTLTLTNGSIVGNIDTGINEDIFVATGGSISGTLNMNFGSDTATISNIDLSTIPTLDGGDDTLVADGFIDTLTLTGYSNLTTNSGQIINWEKIILDGTTLKSSDNALITGTDSGYGLFLTNGSLLNAGITFNLTGNLDIDSTSTFQGYGAGSGVYGVSGSVTNAGTITTQDGAAGDVITVGGDYTGVLGSTYKIDTVLGNDSSITDNLAITGNASGATAINVANVGGTGAQTSTGIKVVSVGGTSEATFTLASPVQAGAYEYTLGQNGNNWYLNSVLLPVPPVDPEVPTTPTKPVTPIYRPGTSNYVSAQTANAEQGFLALGTLHERMNEQQVVSTDKQTWARIYGNTESNDGDSRFNYNQHVRAAQVGQDLYNKTTDNGTNVHSGVMFDYSYSTVDFADRVREDALLDNTTGTMNGTSYGIGGYYTAINGDDSYLDVVGMVSKLENKYKDSYGMKSTQDGYRLRLSVEAGKKLVELGKWKVEGQGQLAYQYTNYDNFNDDISGIDGYGASTLRGRLGVREPVLEKNEIHQKC
jgi:autotransporter family porin